MHDKLFLRSLISMAADKPMEDVFVYFPMHPLASIAQDIIDRPNGIFTVIGYDRPNEEHYVELDTWLQQRDRSHKVFLINEDFLRPVEQTKHLRCLITLNMDHTLMCNLSWLRQYDFAIEQDFHTANSSNKWLSLCRTTRPLRRYAKEAWIDRCKNHFITSFGHERFFGKYNFYSLIDGPDWVTNSLNFFSLKDVYNESCASLVQETGWPTSYTEKIFHAILALHPVLVIGTPGLVSYLRDQGFDMFDDIFNHSYDSIYQDWLRVDTLFSNNMTIICSGLDRSRYRDRLIANRRHVWKYYQDRMTEWQTKLISYLRD